MIPKSLPSDLIRGWQPVSRLREVRFGGQRKVGKDHAQAKCGKGLDLLGLITGKPAVWPTLFTSR
jgi:hypothetical protein